MSRPDAIVDLLKADSVASGADRGDAGTATVTKVVGHVKVSPGDRLSYRTNRVVHRC